MSNWEVVIKNTVTYFIKVEADTKDEATRKAKDLYDENKYIYRKRISKISRNTRKGEYEMIEMAKEKV